MKKLLLCAGVLAVMASCAKYDVDTLAPEAKSNAIVFESTSVDDATRGGFDETESSYVPHWYAEQDQITIWADNAILSTPGATTPAAVTDFTSAAYKATQSERDGKFTSVDINNTWNFNRTPISINGSPKTTLSNFFAFYPAPTDANGYKVEYATNAFTVTVAKDVLASQTQTDAKGAGVYDNWVKWSVSNATPSTSYDAVGEKVNLNFEHREVAGFVFSTEGVKKDYGFGKLKSVTLTARGYVAEDNIKEYEKNPNGYTYKPAEGDIQPSLLNYGTNATMKVTLKYKGQKQAEKVIDAQNTTSLKAATGQGSKTNTVDVSALGDWNDAYKAYMLVKPIDHKEFAKAGVKETFDIEYTFDNITFSVSREASSGMPAGQFADLYNLDLADYNYLVVGNEAPKTLIVFKYEPETMFNEDGDAIIWNGEDVDLGDFDTIISEDAWDADLALIQDFTGLKHLTLNADTKLPKDMLKGIVGQIEDLDAPNVTTVDPSFTNKVAFGDKLTSLKMRSYEFENDTINGYFFNDKVQKSLETLDISGVTSMTATFNVYRTLAFTNYASLETVVLNENGVVVSPKAFMGCTSLETVTGLLDITEAEAAFDMGATGNDVLEAVAITGTVIPDHAFYGCEALTDVELNDAQVAPTVIGKEAFKNCIALEYMDLAKTTTIGFSAFHGCSSYAGAKKDDQLLVVGAKAIEKNTFNGTKLVNVEFTNATSIGIGLFANVSSLNHVKFLKQFEAVATAADLQYWGVAFGPSPAKVDLFVAAGQAYVEGNTKLVLPKTVDDKGNVTATQTITFRSIQTNK